MSTSTSRPCSSRSHISSISSLSAALFGSAFVAGLIHGALLYAGRSPVHEQHQAGTSAWWQHAVLAGLAAALAMAVGIHRRRTGRRRPAVLLPLGRRAALRVRRTLRAAAAGQSRWRLAAALPPTALLVFCVYRAGVQVIGGLDPNFTVNAWGGPGYIGAMACHYLDAALLMASAALLLDVILLPADDGAVRTGHTASRSRGTAAGTGGRPDRTPYIVLPCQSVVAKGSAAQPATNQSRNSGEPVQA